MKVFSLFMGAVAALMLLAGCGENCNGLAIDFQRATAHFTFKYCHF